MARLSNRMGRRKPSLTEAAGNKLMEHDWPGNVRELENTLERALIFNKGDRIDSKDLMLEASLSPRREREGPEDATSRHASLDEVEKRHILDVLARCGQNKMKAAEILGIGYNTLWRKLKKYGAL